MLSWAHMTKIFCNYIVKIFRTASNKSGGIVNQRNSCITIQEYYANKFFSHLFLSIENVRRSVYYFKVRAKKLGQMKLGSYSNHYFEKATDRNSLSLRTAKV